MVEIRLRREMEKNKSILHKVGAPSNLQSAVLGAGASANGKAARSALAAQQDEKASGPDPIQLTEEQIQLFEEENRDMLKHYENTLDQVRCVPMGTWCAPAHTD